LEKRKFWIDLEHPREHSLAYLLGILADARLVTLQIVDKLGSTEVDWQYKPGWNTIGALLDHITAIEHYFRIEFVEGRKLTAEENERWEPAMEMGPHLPELIGIKQINDYKKTLIQSREMMVTALQGLGYEDLVKRREGYDDAEGCNLAWVLFHMVEDEIYHRGQISIIRKLYKEHHGVV